MAEDNDKSLKQRKLLHDFVAAEMKKRNTTLLSKQDMERIKDYLLGKVVTRSAYILKTFVDEENVLCILKNVSFIIRSFSYSMIWLLVILFGNFCSYPRIHLLFLKFGHSINITS